MAQDSWDSIVHGICLCQRECLAPVRDSNSQRVELTSGFSPLPSLSSPQRTPPLALPPPHYHQCHHYQSHPTFATTSTATTTATTDATATKPLTLGLYHILSLKHTIDQLMAYHSDAALERAVLILLFLTLNVYS